MLTICRMPIEIIDLTGGDDDDDSHHDTSAISGKDETTFRERFAPRSKTKHLHHRTPSASTFQSRANLLNFSHHLYTQSIDGRHPQPSIRPASIPHVRPLKRLAPRPGPLFTSHSAPNKLPRRHVITPCSPKFGAGTNNVVTVPYRRIVPEKYLTKPLQHEERILDPGFKEKPASRRFQKRKLSGSEAQLSLSSKTLRNEYRSSPHPQAEALPKSSYSTHIPASAIAIIRPYLSAVDRSDIERGLALFEDRDEAEGSGLDNLILHVDFARQEILHMLTITRSVIGIPETQGCVANRRSKNRSAKSLLEEMRGLLRTKKHSCPLIARKAFETIRATAPELKGRDQAGIAAFLHDLEGGIFTATRKIRITRAQKGHEGIRRPLVDAPLRHRGSIISSCVRPCIEETFGRDIRFQGASGDVVSITWTRDGTGFIAGVTAHSDSHNMQYNKAGNLVVGSLPLEATQKIPPVSAPKTKISPFTKARSRGYAQAIPDHRVKRPIVHTGGNAGNDMRATQDSHMYTSVAYTTYCPVRNLYLTASYDETVKIWHIATGDSNPSMKLRGTWQHTAKVNFVVASTHHDLIATASATGYDAVRIYRLTKENDVSRASYISLGSTLGMKQAPQDLGENAWAYHPSAIKWGKHSLVANLLLVGFSPRAEDDVHIPEERKNTGKLGLWDISEGHTRRIDIFGSGQNIFDVAWHPTRPSFVAAMSAPVECEGSNKTQIRMFTLNERGAFTQTKAFNCPAIDVNEVTIMYF